MKAMKLVSIVLIGFMMFVFSGCFRVDGSVIVRNTHDSNYRVYINNQNKGTVGGYGETGRFYYPDGTELNIYAIQLDGYILYPSEFYSNGTIKAGQTITVSF